MSKVKSVKVKNIALDQNLDEYKNILNGLTGDKRFLDPIIVLDKYSSLIENLELIYKLLNNLNENMIKSYKIDDYNHIKEFLDKLHVHIEKKDVQLDNVIDLYYDIKNSEELVEILNMLKTLNLFHKDLDKENISDIDSDFITDNLTEPIRLFTFGTFNIVDVYLTNPNEKTLKYIVIVLNRLYIPCKAIYKLFTSMDIDVNKLADLIINTLTGLKSKVKGCDKAFNKIENSLNLILNNMDKYYKMFITTKQPEALFSGFLNDIVENETEDDIDMQTILQVKKIMSEFKNMTSQNKKRRPEIDALFNQMDDIFNMLENEFD